MSKSAADGVSVAALQGGAAPSPVPPAVESKNRNLLVRLATALALIPVVLACIYYGGWALGALVAFAAFLNAFELSTMALGKTDSLRVLAGLAAAAVPLLLVSSVGTMSLPVVWIGFTILVSMWRLFRDAPVETAGRDVSAAVFAAIYGSIVGYVIPLRGLGPARDWSGGGWVILVCTLTWLNDTGAYFAGRFFGRHKLYPRISPAKTWEGFVGGMLSSIAGAFIVHALLLPTLSSLDCIALGVLGGCFGPAGDLAESMLKRSYGVKDSGSLLPGHGGMLDRVDALLFNAPVVYLYYRLFIERPAA